MIMDSVFLPHGQAEVRARGGDATHSKPQGAMISSSRSTAFGTIACVSRI